MSRYDIRLVSEPKEIDRLSKDHWREFHDHYPTLNWQYLQHAKCIQAFDDSEAVGYLFMYLMDEPYEPGKVLMVDLYYVDPKHRGTGLADEMFRIAKDYGKENGASRMCASYNLKKPRDRFFTRNGFEATHAIVSKVI